MSPDEIQARLEYETILSDLLRFEETGVMNENVRRCIYAWRVNMEEQGADVFVKFRLETAAAR